MGIRAYGCPFKAHFLLFALRHSRYDQHHIPAQLKRAVTAGHYEVHAFFEPDISGLSFAFKHAHIYKGGVLIYSHSTSVVTFASRIFSVFFKAVSGTKGALITSILCFM